LKFPKAVVFVHVGWTCLASFGHPDLMSLNFIGASRWFSLKAEGLAPAV
jgi:hypothetical protein